MQFHRRLDFSEFLFLFNWAQATPLLLFSLLSLFLFTIITIKFSAHLHKSVNDEKKYWLRKRLNVYQKRSLLIFKQKLLRNLTNLDSGISYEKPNKSV